MGGCASRPKELDGPKHDTAPVDNHAESVTPVATDAPAQKEVAETVAKPETNEEPLVDLSSPKPVDETNQVVALAPEISELTAEAPKAVDVVVATEVAPVAEQVHVTEKNAEAAEVKAEEAKESVVVANDKESEEKVSA